MKLKRPNGMGTLYARGNMWWGGILHKGKMYRMSLGIHVREPGRDPGSLKREAEKKFKSETEIYRLESKEDALVLIKSKIENVKAGISELKKDSSAKLSELFSAFESSKRRRQVNQERLDQYRFLCDELVKMKGAEFAMSEFSMSDAEDYVRKLDEVDKIAPSTFNQKITALIYMWKTVGESVGAKCNPWIDIPKRKTDIKARETFSDEQIEIIKQKCGDRYGGELRTLVIIGANTGMRIGDCASLQWNEVFFDEGFIRKTTKKTGAEISTPLLPELKNELLGLKKRLGGNPSGSVIPKIHASYLRNKSVVSCAFTLVLEKCGMEHSQSVSSSKKRRPAKGFHSFRSTAATRFVEAGVPLEIVRSILGHATDNMTRHYTHVREKAIKDAFDKAGIK